MEGLQLHSPEQSILCMVSPDNNFEILIYAFLSRLLPSLYFFNNYLLGFPGGSNGKESACTEGNLGLIPGSERSPGEGNGNPLQYSCLQNPHGQRSLEGYSPWSLKKSDTLEQLSTFLLPQSVSQFSHSVMSDSL